MSKPSIGEVEAALRVNPDSIDLDTLKQYLDAAHDFVMSNPSDAFRIEKCLQTLRHYIVLKESAAAHRQTICWSKWGVIAAVAAAVFAGIAVFQNCAVSRSDTRLGHSAQPSVSSVQPLPAQVSPPNYNATPTNKTMQEVTP